MQQSVANTSSTSSHPKRRWRKILIAIAVLFVLLLISAEIILSTNLPRNLVISLVEKQLGLRITANSLSTGFFGHTTLSDVTVTLPLASHAFLTVPTLHLDHTWLPGIIVGSFSVQKISIDQPRLDVTEGPDGNWNLQQVAQLLARLGGSNNPQQIKSSSNNDIPLLPSLEVNDAAIVVTDNQRRSTTIDHMILTGYPDGPVVWQYRASVPGQLDISGKLAPGGPWAHEVDLQIHDAQSWFSPWISSWQPSAQFQAHWSGRIDSGNLLGRLDIEHANYASVSLTGPIEIQSQNGNAIVRPIGLLISPNKSPDDNSRAMETRIDGGNVVISDTTIQSQAVGIEFAQGRASLDAQYNFADNSASLHTVWRDLTFPSGVIQSGDLQANYSNPLGQSRFTATLQNHGTLKEGQWNASISLAGSGNNLTNLSLNLTAHQLRFDSNSGKTLDLSGLTAKIGSYADGLLLHDLTVGTTHPLTGAGGYSIAKKSAWLSLDGHLWPLPGESSKILNVDLNIWENPQRVRLEKLYFSAGPVSAFIDGDYVFNVPRPVNAHAYLTEKARLVAINSQTEQFRGALRSTIDLTGTLYPVDLLLTGSARGHDVHIGPRPLGDVKLDLVGYFRDNKISIGSRDVQLLGGAWTVNGQWPIRDGLFRIDNLSVKHLSLPLAADTDEIAGTLEGKWSIDVRDLTPDGIVVDGSATIHNLVVGNPKTSTLPQYLTFDKIDMRSTRLEDGIIDIDPISVTRNVGPNTGRADLQLSTSVEHPQILNVDLLAKSWPVMAAGSPTTSLISAKGNLDIDLSAKSADGHIDLASDVFYGNQPTPLSPSPGLSRATSRGTLGEGRGEGRTQTNTRTGERTSSSPSTTAPIPTLSPAPTTDLSPTSKISSTTTATTQSSAPFAHFEASLDILRRQIDAPKIEIQTLRGSATGSGFFDFDNPFKSSRLDLDWKNLDLAALKPFSASLATLAGKSDGSLRVYPATDPRTLGPIAIDVQIQSHRINFKNLYFGNFQAAAFLGPDRFVLDNSPTRPTQVEFAFGIIRFWGRVAKHGNDVYQSLLQIDLEHLNIETLVPMGAKVARTPGMLSGQITIVGRPKTPGLAFGSGSLFLTQSDLAGTGPIAFLYNLMNISHNAKKPTGSGEIDFTIQNEGATVTAMRYFDKGSEVRVSGQISDLPNIPNSPIHLIAVGSARPLASIRLPGIADFDEAIGAIQHDAFTVLITGTLAHPQTNKIPFSDITQEMKNLLFGDAGK